MYVFLCPLIMVIIINCLCTITLTNSSTNNNNNRIVRNLKHIVDTAIQQDTSDDINSELLIEQLSRILEQEEGFRIVDRKRRSIFPTGDDGNMIFDGSGDIMDDEETPTFYANMSVIALTMGTTTTAFTKYTPHTYPPCQCEKGERGDKGDAGICPADCRGTYNAYARDCLGPRINLERLAQSIRQLIIDTKKIAYRNARAMPCVCQAPPSPPTTTTMSNQFSLDYNIYAQLKGEKGDTGTSCSPTCMQSAHTNVRVFTTLQQAMDASVNYPDHTYVHIVNEYGRLQGVYIRTYGQLIPLRLESENSLVVQEQTLPPTTISIPKSQCTVKLSCPRLHIFALGPYVRKMCNSKRADIFCSKLSDYDDLCGRVSERHHLKGFYRALMSTSTQWLSNFFAGICVNARFVNMHEQTLFDTFEEIFEQKPPQNELLDVQGLTPRFQYWWHGSFTNGTASSDTCLDWSRHESSLSGIASRIPDGSNGLFYPQNKWPCSIADSNMGILCIETNCDKDDYYKH